MRQEKQKNNNNKRREEKQKIKAKTAVSLLNPKSKFCFYACLKLIFASTSGRSVSLRKQLFLLAPQHLRTLREGLSATQRQKFHTDDINQCLIINPVVMGFQMQIFQFYVSPGRSSVMCSSAKELQQNSNASYREEYVPQILTVFVIDLSHLYLCSHLSFLCHL